MRLTNWLSIIQTGTSGHIRLATHKPSRTPIHINMTRPTNSRNTALYKWYIHGTICGQEFAQKYCSLTEFLDDFGGDKTVLNLNRTKLARLKRKWHGNMKKPEYTTRNHTQPTDPFLAANWDVHFVNINERRDQSK